eukprot:jgi/Mesvir1/6460/Mv19539-RA.1
MAHTAARSAALIAVGPRPRRHRYGVVGRGMTDGVALPTSAHRIDQDSAPPVVVLLQYAFPRVLGAALASVAVSKPVMRTPLERRHASNDMGRDSFPVPDVEKGLAAEEELEGVVVRIDSIHTYTLVLDASHVTPVVMYAFEKELKPLRLMLEGAASSMLMGLRVSYLDMSKMPQVLPEIGTAFTEAVKVDLQLPNDAQLVPSVVAFSCGKAIAKLPAATPPSAEDFERFLDRLFEHHGSRVPVETPDE